MTAERLLTIKQLLSHPAGVGPVWTKNLVEELMDAIVCDPPEEEAVRQMLVPTKGTGK